MTPKWRHRPILSIKTSTSQLPLSPHTFIRHTQNAYFYRSNTLAKAKYHCLFYSPDGDSLSVSVIIQHSWSVAFFAASSQFVAFHSRRSWTCSIWTFTEEYKDKVGFVRSANGHLRCKSASAAWSLCSEQRHEVQRRSPNAVWRNKHDIIMATSRSYRISTINCKNFVKLPGEHVGLQTESHSCGWMAVREPGCLHKSSVVHLRTLSSSLSALLKLFFVAK